MFVEAMFHRRKAFGAGKTSAAAAIALRRGRVKWRGAGYCCQVRFLWRCRRSFLRRLCLLIFALRRFLIEPISGFMILIYDLNPNDLVSPGIRL
jgi:hypothetical protein